MKIKTIACLSVCALALGAVVGVIGTQRVQEAKAGEGDITVYFRDAEWWVQDGACASVYLWGGSAPSTSWPGNLMTKVETKGGLNVWKYTLNTTEYKNLIFSRVSSGNQDWGAKTVDIDLSTFDPEKPLYDISGQTTPIWGDPGVTGTWTAYEEPAPSSSEASSEESSESSVSEKEYFLVGSFNEWKAGDENYKFEKMGEQKEGKDQYKLDFTAVADNTAIKVNDGVNWYPDGMGNEYTIEDAGDYTIYFVPEGVAAEDWHEGFFYVAPVGPETSSSEESSGETSSESSVSEKEYFLVGSFNEWKAGDENYKFEKMGEQKEGKDQYKLEFTAVADNTAIKVNDGVNWYPDGTGNEYTIEDAGDYTIYFVPEGVAAEDWYLGYFYVAPVDPGTSSSEESSGESSSEASTSEESSFEPITEGYIYISTGDYGYGSKMYLYTWTTEEDKNADWPGLEINAENYPTASCTTRTNFHGLGGLWKVPASVLKAKFIVTITEPGYSDPTVQEETGRHKTEDLVSAANIFVGPEWSAQGVAESGPAAEQAALVHDIQAAIWNATDHSVCMVSKTDAQSFVERYDALTDKAFINNSTYYTYDGTVPYDQLKSIEGQPDEKNFLFSDIIEQLRVIAGQNAGAWSIGGVTGNVTLIITVSVVTAGIAAAAALYLISKKRRLQK